MKKRLVFALSTTLLCYLLFLFFYPLYYSSDSLMAAIVVDGLFSANNFSQFQHPLFCIIVRILTPLLPTVDVFTMILHLTVALGFFSLAYYLSAPAMVKPLKSWRVPDFIYIIILFLGIVFLSAGVNIWNNNYTITAGAFVFMGLVLNISLFDNEKRSERDRRVRCIVSVVMIAMGIMLRRESALLFLPFIILDLTISVMEQRYEWKHVFRRYMPCLLAFLLLIGSREIMYSIEPYATASRYNAARTAIMDFPMKSASEVDVDPIDYNSAISYWTFADTGNMNVEKLEEIAAAGTKNAYTFSWAGFTSVVSKIKHDVFHTNLYMSILVVATALLLLRNLLCAGLWGKAESVLAVLGALTIMIYFTFRGRAPMRVWEPVLMATNYVLIQAAANSVFPAKVEMRVDWPGTVNTIAMLLIAVTLWFSTGQVMAYGKLNAQIRTTLTARVETDDSEYRTDALYIWPNWHGTIPKYYEKAGTLPPQDIIDHNIALGDWTYGQPYYNEFLSRIGAENPIQLLLDGKAYIMGGGIENYLRRHYGDDIRLVETGTVIEEMKAYRVERTVDSRTEIDSTAIGGGDNGSL